MRLKIVTSLLLQVGILTPALATPYVETIHEKLQMIKAHSLSQPTSETCTSIVEISNKLKKDLFEKSCTTDSDIGFTFCQQTTNAFNSTEMHSVQSALEGLQALNDTSCKDKSPSFLAKQIDAISKNLVH